MFDPAGPTLKDNNTQTGHLRHANKDQKEYEANKISIHGSVRAELAWIRLDVAEYQRATVAHALRHVFKRPFLKGWRLSFGYVILRIRLWGIDCQHGGNQSCMYRSRVSVMLPLSSQRLRHTSLSFNHAFVVTFRNQGSLKHKYQVHNTKWYNSGYLIFLDMVLSLFRFINLPSRKSRLDAIRIPVIKL